MKTIREQKLGDTLARLLEVKGQFAGVLIKDGRSEPPIRGEDADVVWAALVQQADRSGPSYFGA